MSTSTQVLPPASTYATRDRSKTADHILNAACRDAVRLIRLGRRPSALVVLTRASQSADRVLGHTRLPGAGL